MPTFVDIGRGIWVRADEIVVVREGQPRSAEQLLLEEPGAEGVQAVVVLRRGQVVDAYRDAKTIVAQLEGGASPERGRVRAEPAPGRAETVLPSGTSEHADVVGKRGELEGKTTEPAGRTRRINPIQLQKYLKGINYPTQKQGLLEAAARNAAPDDVRSAIERLPEQAYNAPKEVSREIGKLQ